MFDSLRLTAVKNIFLNFIFLILIFTSLTSSSLTTLAQSPSPTIAQAAATKPSEKPTKEAVDTSKLDLTGSCNDPIGWREIEEKREENSRSYYAPRNSSTKPTSNPKINQGDWVIVVCAFDGKINYIDKSDSKFKLIDNNIKDISQSEVNEKLKDNQEFKDQAASITPIEEIKQLASSSSQSSENSSQSASSISSAVSIVSSASSLASSNSSSSSLNNTSSNSSSQNKADSAAKSICDGKVTKENKGYIYINTANDFQSYFHCDPNQGWLYVNESAKDKSDWVSLKVNKVAVGSKKMAINQAIIQGNKITYPNVFKDVDLQYIVTSTSVKKYFVLNSKEALNTDFSKINFNIHTDKSLIETGETSIISKTESIISSADEKPNSKNLGIKSEISKTKKTDLQIQPPLTFEKNKNDGTDTKPRDEKWSFDKKTGQYTIYPDLNYLKDSRRQFPILIDPTTLSQTPSQDAWIEFKGNSPRGNYNPNHLVVGGMASLFCTTYNCPANINDARTLLNFPLPGINSDSKILSSQLWVQVYSHNGSNFDAKIMNLRSDFNERTVTWNSGYSDSDRVYSKMYFDGAPNTRYWRASSDISDLIRDSRGNGKVLMELRDSDENQIRGAVFCSKEGESGDPSSANGCKPDSKPSLQVVYENFTNYAPASPIANSPDRGDLVGGCNRAATPGNNSSQQGNCSGNVGVGFEVSNINDGNNGDRDRPSVVVRGTNYNNGTTRDYLWANPANPGTQTFGTMVESGIHKWWAANADSYGAWSPNSNTRFLNGDNGSPQASTVTQVQGINTVDGKNYVGRSDPNNTTPQVTALLPQYFDNSTSRVVITPVLDSNKAIDVNAGALSNGAAITIWDKNYQSTSQKWLWDGAYLKINGQNKCLSSSSPNVDLNTNIQLWDCIDARNQEYLYDPVTKEIKVRGINKCLDLAYGSTSRGNGLAYYDCHGGNNQKWNIEVLEHVRIKHSEGKSLNYYPDVSTVAPNLFETYEDFEGLYYNQTTKELLSPNNFCLDGKNLNPGDVVYLFTCHGGTNQKWIFEVLPGTSTPVIRSVGKNNICLHLNTANNGQAFTVQNCNGSSNQNLVKEPFFKYLFPGIELNTSSLISTSPNFEADKTTTFGNQSSPVLQAAGPSIEDGKTYFLSTKAQDRSSGRTANTSSYSTPISFTVDSTLPTVNNLAYNIINNPNSSTINIETSEKNFLDAKINLIRLENGNRYVAATLDKCLIGNQVQKCDYTKFDYVNKNSSNYYDPTGVNKLQFVWDGKDSNGNKIPDGQYEVQPVVTDKAKNANKELLKANGTEPNFLTIDNSTINLSIVYPSYDSWTNQKTLQLRGAVGGFNYDAATGNTRIGSSGDIQKLELEKLDLDGPNTVSNGHSPKQITVNDNKNWEQETNLDLGQNEFKLNALAHSGTNSKLIGDPSNQNTNNNLGLKNSWKVNYENTAPKITGIYPSNENSNSSILSPIVGSNSSPYFNFQLQDTNNGNLNQVSGLNTGVNPKGYDISLIRSLDGKNDFREIPIYKNGVNISDPNPNPRLASDLVCTPNLTSGTTYKQAPDAVVNCTLQFNNLRLDGYYILYVRAVDLAGNEVCSSLENIPVVNGLTDSIKCKTSSISRITNALKIKTLTYNQVIAPNPAPNTDITSQSSTVLIKGRAEKNSQISLLSPQFNREVWFVNHEGYDQITPDEYQASPRVAIALNKAVSVNRNFTSDSRKLTVNCNLGNEGWVDTDGNTDTPKVEVCEYSYVFGLVGNTVKGQPSINNIQLNVLNTVLAPTYNLRVRVDNYDLSLNSKPSTTLISPNGDGQFDSIEFENSLVDANQIQATTKGAYTRILDSLGNTVYYSATSSLQKYSKFDGKYNLTGPGFNSGDWLKDGEYTYNYLVSTDSWNTISQLPIKFTAKSNLSAAEKVVINTPISNYTTTRGVINVQGQAPISTTNNKFKVNVCADLISTSYATAGSVDSNICLSTATIDTTSTGFYSVILTLPYPDSRYNIRVNARDGAGNVTPESVIQVDYNLPESIKNLEVVSSLDGLNTKRELDCLTINSSFADCANFDINKAKTLKITTTVSKNTEAVEIDFADLTNLNELANTNSQRIAIINNATENNPKLNPLQDARIKQNLNGTRIIDSNPARNVSSGRDLATKSIKNSCNLEVCQWTFNYAYPNYFSGGKYEIKVKSYKGDSVDELSKSFEVNGIIKTSPQILRADKNQITAKCAYINSVIAGVCNDVEPVRATSLNQNMNDRGLSNSVTNYYTNTSKLKVWVGGDSSTQAAWQISKLYSDGAMSDPISGFNKIDLPSRGIAAIDVNLPNLNPGQTGQYVLQIGNLSKNTDGTYKNTNTLSDLVPTSITTYVINFDRELPTLDWVTTSTSLQNTQAINPWIRNGDQVTISYQTNEATDFSYIIGENGYRVLGDKSYTNPNQDCNPYSQLDLRSQTSKPIPSPCSAAFFNSKLSTGKLTVLRESLEGVFSPTIFLQDLAGNTNLVSNDITGTTTKNLQTQVKNNLIKSTPGQSDVYDFDAVGYSQVSIVNPDSPEVKNGDGYYGTQPLPANYPYSRNPRNKSLDFRLFIDSTNPLASEFDINNWGCQSPANQPPLSKLGATNSCMDGIAADGISPEKDRLAGTRFVTRNNQLKLKAWVEKNQRVALLVTDKSSQTNSTNTSTKVFYPEINSYDCVASKSISSDKASFGGIVTQFKEVCDTTFTYNFTGLGLSPNGDPLDYASFAFYPLDLAGNTSLTESQTAKLENRSASNNCNLKTGSDTYLTQTRDTNSIGSCSILVYFDKDAPLTKDQAENRNISENRNNQTGLLIGASIQSIKSPSYNNGQDNIVGFDAASSITNPITKDTTVDLSTLGEQKADLETKITPPLNQVTKQASAPLTSVQQLNSDFTASSKLSLGYTKDQTSTNNQAINSCILTSNTPTPNRRVGICEDGIYTIQQNLTDTAGNKSTQILQLVERDTVAPADAVVTILKSGNRVKGEIIDLKVVGEANSTLEINTKLNGNDTITTSQLDSVGVFANPKLLTMTCGSKYEFVFRLTDKAGNSSNWTTKTISSEACLVCASSGTGSFKLPVNNIAPNEEFGSYKSGGVHYGMDFAANNGTSVLATNNGTIVELIYGQTKSTYNTPEATSANSNYGAGNLITIQHSGGIYSTYFHLQNKIATNPTTKQPFKPGDTVNMGQVIGYMGNTGNSTGSHLHFQIEDSSRAGFSFGTMRKASAINPRVVLGNISGNVNLSRAEEVNECQGRDSKGVFGGANPEIKDTIEDYYGNKTISYNVDTNNNFIGITTNLSPILAYKTYKDSKNNIFGGLSVYKGMNVDISYRNPLGESIVGKGQISESQIKIYKNSVPSGEFISLKTMNGASYFDIENLDLTNFDITKDKLCLQTVAKVESENKTISQPFEISGNCYLINNLVNFNLNSPLWIQGSNSITSRSDVLQNTNYNKLPIKLNIKDDKTTNLEDILSYNNNKDVWIVSHGFNDSYNGDINKITSDIKIKNPNAIVLGLDWSIIAHGAGIDTGSDDVCSVATWIKPIADKVAQRLINWGLTNPSKINLVGHSLGTLLSAQIGQNYKDSTTKKVNKMILLDPPSEERCGHYKVQAYPGQNRVDRFDSVSEYSVSFVGNKSLAGNQQLAKTAHKSFWMEFDSSYDLGREHFWVLQTFERINRSDFLTDNGNKPEGFLSVNDTDSHSNWQSKCNRSGWLPGWENWGWDCQYGIIEAGNPSNYSDGNQYVHDGDVQWLWVNKDGKSIKISK